MIDDGGQQAAREALAAVRRPHGNGQELRFVGGHAAQGETGIITIDLQQQTGHAGRGNECGKILPGPGALAESRERLGMQRGGPVEIERPQPRDGRTVGHSIDGTARAVRQGDVDAAQVERARQAFLHIAGAPGIDAHVAGQSGERDGIGNDLLDDRVDPGRHKIVHQRLGAGADHEARTAGDAGREIARRRHEGCGIALADGAEPVAQPAVDGGDHQPVARWSLGEQDRRRGDASQGHGETDGQAARGGQAHANAGKTARPDGHGNERELAPIDGGVGKHGLDRRQQARRLVAARFRKTGEPHAVAHHGHTHAADGAIEGEDRHVYSWFMKLDLVAIAPPDFDVDVTLAYATEANLTGQPVYRNAECWLHREAAEKLAAAIALARPLGLRLRIFDALRPVEAQWALWNARPDPEFLADPRRGSPHSRGVAVDLTLLDGDHALDMGTAFDAFTPLSHHGRTDVSAEAQRNRLLLMGLMTSAGWDFYRNEWWHYQLFDQRRYPLVSDADLPRPMM
jgi:D-alanyl-D-alanine dipeptidase